MPRRSSRASSGSGETIVALSTPAGASLRAVVRLSGPRAREMAAGLPGSVFRRGPATYTREDLVEIHLPGSPPLVDALLRLLVSRGARPARPGEFTLRAFLHGRLDLVQAEAVEQLIASEGEEDRRAALDQLAGGFSRRLHAIEERLLDLTADLEAAIDFTDQDIEILSESRARERAAGVLEEIRALAAETATRRSPEVRPLVLLYGRPNAGKSTLFNALTGADALVSPRAGTTRDVLAADLDVGVPVRLLDAAGVGEDPASGGLEASVGREAVRRAEEALRRADAVLLVADASDPGTDPPPAPSDRPVVRVLSKWDRVRTGTSGDRFAGREAVRVSARTGEGLAELREALSRLLGAGPDRPAARFRLDVRQQAQLREAESALARAAGGGPGLEFAALDLREALSALGAVSGRNVGEDLLDRVFSRFCLGK